MKKIFYYFCSIIMILSIFVSNIIPASAVDNNSNYRSDFIKVLLDNESLWNPENYEVFSFLDIDFDGKLELVCGTSPGTYGIAWSEIYGFKDNKVFKFKDSSGNYDYNYFQDSWSLYYDYLNNEYSWYNIESEDGFCPIDYEERHQCKTNYKLLINNNTITRDYFSADCNVGGYFTYEKKSNSNGEYEYIAKDTTLQKYNDTNEKILGGLSEIQYHREYVNIDSAENMDDDSLWSRLSYNEKSELLYKSYNGFSYNVVAPQTILDMDDVWGFSNHDIQGSAELKHYNKFFMLGVSNLLYEIHRNETGLCSGMVTALVSSYGHNIPPLNTFRTTDNKVPKKYSEITSPDTYNSFLNMDISDFIKYAHVYQFTPLSGNGNWYGEESLHSNDMDGLFNSVENCLYNKGEYVEISIRGYYKDKYVGHSILAIGIGANNNEKTELIVYDSNCPNDKQILKLYKQNGKYIAWEYKPIASLDWKYDLDWGTGKKGNWISYNTIGNDFARDFANNTFNGFNSYKLIEVTNNDLTVDFKNGNIGNLQDSDYKKNMWERIISSNLSDSAETDDSSLYWINNDEISVTSKHKNSISFAGENDIIKSDIPQESSLDIGVDTNNICFANYSNLKAGQKIKTEYNKFVGTNTEKIVVSGNATKSNASTKCSEDVYSITGLGEVEVSISDNNQNPETIKLDCDGDSIEITNNKKGSIIIKQDKDGDGVYETEYTNPTPTIATESVMPDDITLNKSSITIGVGETYDLISRITPDNANKTIYWGFDNDIVDIDDSGRITALAEGMVTVTAEAFNGLKAACKVTVKKAPTKMYLSKTKLTLGVGESFDLDSNVKNGQASYTRTFESGDTSIATVKQNGVVKAKKKGTVKISVTAFNGVKAVCTITIKKAPKKIKLNKTSLKLKKGKKYKLKSSVPKGQASYQRIYTSNNKKVATVTSKGVIKAKKKGKVKIKVKTFNGKTAICKVKVV